MYAKNIYEEAKDSGRLSRFKYKRMYTHDGRREIFLFLDISMQRYALLMVFALSVGIGVLWWGGMLLYCETLTSG